MTRGTLGDTLGTVIYGLGDNFFTAVDLVQRPLGLRSENIPGVFADVYLSGRHRVFTFALGVSPHSNRDNNNARDFNPMLSGGNIRNSSEYNKAS